MRFLCLHGLGTSNYVLETQFATIRHELDRHHTYEFAEGTKECAIATEIRDMFPAKDLYFQYYTYDTKSFLAALNHLAAYITAEGPFDGVIGFSQGAALASTYLLQCSQQRPLEPLPFRCAVFLSASRPFDPQKLQEGQMQHFELGQHRSPPIDIPTAHIWGCNDKAGKDDCIALFLLVDNAQAAKFVHSGGHEIPGPRVRDDVQGCVRAIRRTVGRAEGKFA